MKALPIREAPAEDEIVVREMSHDLGHGPFAGGRARPQNRFVLPGDESAQLLRGRAENVDGVAVAEIPEQPPFAPNGL